MRHFGFGARRIALAVVSTMPLLGLQVMVWAPAARATTCSFDAGSHVASVSASGFQPDVDMAMNGGNFIVDGLICGTALTLDTVNIDLHASADASVRFFLSGGPFAPGFTDEPGNSDEIEFNILDLGADDGVGVTGTDAAESFAVGQHLAIPTPDREINMNVAQDGATLDVDVTIGGTPAAVGLAARGGDDTLTAMGTGGMFSQPATMPVGFGDGLGADTVIGGFGDDQIETGSEPDPGDNYSGGPGTDRIEFEQSGGLTVTLDGQPNDGTLCPGLTCEADNVMPDIEQLLALNGDATLVGGPGPQLLVSGNGHNTLKGGPGNDTLTAGDDTDVFDGGTGSDTVTYEFHLPGVNVSLDGKPNDGTSGEHDNVLHVEEVVGSQGDDRLIGSDGADRLFGYLGDDVIDGRGGDDRLDGGAFVFGFLALGQPDGSDVLLGGGGVDTVVEDGKMGGLRLSIDDFPNDQVKGDPSQGIDDIRTDVENVIGGPDADTITGSASGNVILGRGGDDALRGLAGKDTLKGGAGDDTLTGGLGNDRCIQGPGSGSRTGCEH